MRRAVSISEAIHAYLAAVGYATKTGIQYRSRLGELERRYGRYKTNSLTRAVLFDYLYGPGGVLVGASRSRGDNHRTALQGLIRYASDMEWMPYIRVPKAPTPEPEYVRDWTYLTGDELLAVQEAANNERLRTAIAIAANTALRIEDVLTVETAKVRVARGEMRVWINKSKTWDTKPITLDLEPVLKEALAGHPGGKYLIPGFQRHGLNKRGGSYTDDYNKTASYTWAQLGLKKALDAAGIARGERECWHMIRRSVARRYFDRLVIDGYDYALRLTQAMLNHKNAATTERYLGLRREYAARNESLKGLPFLSNGSGQ